MKRIGFILILVAAVVLTGCKKEHERIARDYAERQIELLQANDFDGFMATAYETSEWLETLPEDEKEEAIAVIEEVFDNTDMSSLMNSNTSGNSDDSGNSNTARRGHICGFCGGSGICPICKHNDGVQYGDMKYCKTCGNTHRCPKCGGNGIVYD